MDGLHPYNEDDVYSSWTRLPGTSTVLVAVARKDALERYAAPFEEAGIRIGGFTCSAAAIYSALRLFGSTPAPELLALDDSTGELEYYGESPTRPIFSASFGVGNEPAAKERAVTLASSELRISNPAPVSLASLFGLGETAASLPSAPGPPCAAALPFAAALASACPLLSLPLNLLPDARRQASSRLRWVPAIAFGTVVLLLAAALAAFPYYENRKYLKSLQAQIAAVAPKADRAGAIDKQVETLRRRIQLLDDLRAHPKADMDVMAELTRLLPPPTWLTLMQVSPKQVVVGGEAPEAAPLVPLIDSSRLFEASEFQAAPLRLPNGEQFRIKTNRRGVK
jgi:Tfp pilus assembly protein PilN